MMYSSSDLSKNKGKISRIVEAILFSSGNWMSIKEIRKYTGRKVKEDNIEEYLKTLKEEYVHRDSALTIRYDSNQDKWKMDVRDEYYNYVVKLGIETELGKSLIETLSYIAWKSPVMQSYVIKSRSTTAYKDINRLVELGLIVKKKKGNSYLLSLSKKFYDYFETPNSKRIKSKLDKIGKTVESKYSKSFSKDSGNSSISSQKAGKSAIRDDKDDSNGKKIESKTSLKAEGESKVASVLDSDSYSDSNSRDNVVSDKNSNIDEEGSKENLPIENNVKHSGNDNIDNDKIDNGNINDVF